MNGVHSQPYAVHFKSTIHFVFGHKSHQTTFCPFCEINLHFHKNNMSQLLSSSRNYKVLMVDKGRGPPFY